MVGLISGGKDSCYNLMCCKKEGHEIVCLANLFPYESGEIDSYMYQSVGTEGTKVSQLSVFYFKKSEQVRSYMFTLVMAIN